MTEKQQQTRKGPATPGASPGGTRVPRPFGFVMLAEAVTLGVASYLHRGGRIPLGFTVIHGEHAPGASTPEAIIGAVLAAGAVLVLVAPVRARVGALVAVSFAIFGVLVGLAEVLRDVGGASTTDLTYHATLLTALAATLVMLALQRVPPRPGRAAAGRQRSLR
ncbi:MAG TPA: hypothetical protein VKV80_04280 [Streptosporangiaceae bacterium]|nr:hypothetical protein [Streptosporangiaceae bacterium]